MTRTVTTFKTAVFRLHNPSKRCCAMLDHALRSGHQIYTRALNELLPVLPSLVATENQRERRIRLTKTLKAISATVITPSPLGNAAKSGVLSDLEKQALSYCELFEKKLSPSPPTASRIWARAEHWENALHAMARSIGEGEERDATASLLTEAKAGTLRPLEFPRNRVMDGFLLLRHAERERYGVWLNLVPATSRFYKPRKVDGWADVRTGEVLQISVGTGAIFPVEFGAEHQLARFIQQGQPKSAKLVKKSDSYEVHIAFAFEADAVETRCWLGVDRGIYNLVSLCVVDADGRAIARENVSGRALRFVQRQEERRQRKEQRQGKRYRSSARRAMADEASHVAANRIAAMAVKHQAQVVMEELRMLKGGTAPRGRSNFNRLLGRAQYGKVETILSYKLALHGLPAFKTVAAAGTSQTCPECGHRAKENRAKTACSDGFDMSRFKCISCGFSDDADLNAARILGQKKMWRDQLPAKLKKSLAKELPAEHSFECFLRDCASRRAR